MIPQPPPASQIPPLPSPTPKLTTMDFMIRGGGILAAVVVLIYAVAVFTGRSVIPQSTQDALQPLISTAAVAAVGALIIYFQKRSADQLSDGLGTKIGMTAAGQTALIAEQVAAALKVQQDEAARLLAIKVEADAKIVDAARMATELQTAQGAAKLAADKLISDAKIQADLILSEARAEASRHALATQVAALPTQVAAIPGITAQPVGQGPITAENQAIVEAVEDTTASVEKVAANTTPAVSFGGDNAGTINSTPTSAKPEEGV
jgi:hypothetical protein